MDWKKLFEVAKLGSGNSGALERIAEKAIGGDYKGYTFSVSNQEIIFYVDGVVDKTYTADGTMTALGTAPTSRNRYGFLGDGSEASSQNGGRNGIYFDE